MRNIAELPAKCFATPWFENTELESQRTRDNTRRPADNLVYFISNLLHLPARYLHYVLSFIIKLNSFLNELLWVQQNPSWKSFCL